MTDQQQLKVALEQLVADGLSFATVMCVFGAQPKDARADRIIAAAKSKWQDEGECEIDDSTVTSGCDGTGDYVLAWVWAEDPGAKDD